MTQPEIIFARARERVGRLPVSSKFYQALGGLPDAFKTWAFNTFLLLYYNQILGLPASWVSLVLMLALAVDAVTDPMVGAWSDGLRSRFGRRHGMMYASILPLGLSLFAIFNPPSGLSHPGLVAWLALFAIGARVAMTFFLIPWSALFPELTDDYAERSEVLTWRYLVSGAGTVLFTVAVWSYIFPSSARFTPGQLNPQGYPIFALVLSLSVMAAALLTTALTQREIPYLRQPAVGTRFSLRLTLRDTLGTLRNPDFRILFIGLLLSSTISGTLGALDIYMMTYFWGLTPEQLRWFAIGGIGGIIAFALIPALQKRLDKKHLLIAAMMISLVNGLAFIGMRFAGVLPPADDPWLLRILLANEVFRIALAFVIGVMFVSMIADTIDAQELHSGRRQEGVFSAAISFANKAISGLGILAAGILLDLMVRLPPGVTPATLPPGAAGRLGLTVMAVSLLYLLPFWIASRYSISRARHREILYALAERRTAGLAPN
ncbi:MFS transporter [Sandaracinobacteroides saxicola]|uniref:MFS transporter n=1 Tax=Sandaracinobacteroides saxicola TaxID=2759707 RepID=A0A7G5IM28_9SPHN|nr:MFS transporter [Sandaracinobacteroides saxicola]QMW24420.1 MFS transporter [Sandaracinobacteroides saxicola]